VLNSFKTFAASAAIVAASTFGLAAHATDVTGAGSSFVYPVVSKWSATYAEKTGNRINYQSIGSGGGIAQIKAGTVDFGATDMPLTEADLEKFGLGQFPDVIGGIVPALNVEGIAPGKLVLDGSTLAGIFLGKITTWHDPIVQKDNPGVTLPNLNIVVAHRSDGSGTTAAFTTYLSAVSPEWAAKVGSGGAVSWPVGLGGKGSEGVTAQVRQSPGGIGYVELIYAQQNKLAIASIRNQAGKYIAPSEASTTAAITAFSAQIDKDPRLPIVNAPASAPEAYPISTLTFLIVPKDGKDAAKRSALKKFIQYIVTSGQATAGALNYAPLPDGVKQYDQNLINQMTVNGQPIQ